MTNKEILQQFEIHLQNQGQRLTSVSSNISNIKRFLEWLNKQNINYLEVNYTDLMAFVNYCKEKGNKTRTINLNLNSIKHFYNCLQDLKLTDYNPCEELRIKGEIRRQPQNLLSWEELEQLHQNYPNGNITGKRNKVIVGMMIFQGLNSGEISKLEVKDIDLENAKIYIPSVGRSNSRTLNLQGMQLITLQKYITDIRPYLVKLKGENYQSELLFLSSGIGSKLNNSLSQLMKKAREINSKITNPTQIKSSVITYWLTKYGIREVQYMAGHKYVSSTERYRTDLLGDLQENIDKLHPLQ